MSVLDAGFWLTAVAVLLLLVLSGFFSGSETALTASSRGKLRASADKGERGAQVALALTDDGERLIGSVLLGNNLVNILATSLATALLTRIFGESGVALATLVMTLLVLIFAEVLPKTYAITNPERAAAFVARPIAVVVRVFAPAVAAVRWVVRRVLALVGVETDPDMGVLAVREEIAGALHLGHSEGVVEKEDRDRILGALDLADRAVEEVMLHRSGIEMIDSDLPPDVILAQCLASNHTRLPLFKDDPENIIGVIHAKDLLRAIHSRTREAGSPEAAIAEFDVMAVARAPYFVPVTAMLDDQMREFLQRKVHFALIVDEYGALRGLLTLEDILEEIVGEITDEFDHEPENHIAQDADGAWVVEGSMTIRDLNRAMEWALPDDEANTVAGLVIHEAQMIPAEGQVFSFHGFRFEVAQKAQNRIALLRMRKL